MAIGEDTPIALGVLGALAVLAVGLGVPGVILYAAYQADNLRAERHEAEVRRAVEDYMGHIRDPP